MRQVNAQLNAGCLARNRGDYKAALPLLQGCGDESNETLYLLADTYLRLGRHEDAARTFSRVQDSFWGSPYGHAQYELGRLLRKRGDFVAAKKCFEDSSFATPGIACELGKMHLAARACQRIWTRLSPCGRAQITVQRTAASSASRPLSRPGRQASGF